MPLSLNLLRINDLSLAGPLSIACARAFSNESYIYYLLPDKRKRENLRYLYQYHLRMCIAGGYEAYTTSANCEGVAVWLSSETREPFGLLLRGGNPFPALRCGLRNLLWEIKASDHCTKIRKKLLPQPHMYLVLLAVDPSFQGKGYAGALMRPVLDRSDKLGLPCYVETHSIQNVAFYRHFGFQVVREIDLPPIPHPFYALLRKQ